MDKSLRISQASIEFLALSGFLLFIFAIIAGIIMNNTVSNSKKRMEMLAQDTLTKAQREIELASRVVDGYYRNFTLPDTIAKKNYTIEILNSSTEFQVNLRIEGQDFFSYIPPVEGNLTRGVNHIRKDNGTIQLN